MVVNDVIMAVENLHNDELANGSNTVVDAKRRSSVYEEL